MPKKYHGAVIPMITPFTDKGKVDHKASVRVTEHLVDGGTYPFLLGTTGESASIPVDERIDFVAAVMSVFKGRTTAYAGISDNSIETSLRMANAFYDSGVDVLVAHLPSYYPLKPEHMLGYYTMLADRSPLPVIIYNILSTTHMSIPLEIVEKLSHHPNIAGMKDSERDLDRMKRSAELFRDRDDFAILCGWTTQSAPTLLMGFDGIVPNPGNVTPALFAELYEAAAAGDRAGAESLQERANEVAAIFQKDKTLTEVFAGLKVMMEAMGFGTSHVLPPLTRLEPDEEARIVKAMKQMRILG